MDGQYNVVLHTPMGNNQGIIILRTNASELKGIINFKGNNTPFYGGKISGNKFQFSGEIRLFTMKIFYNAIGTVEGNRLKGNVRTKYGTFMMEGTKIK